MPGNGRRRTARRGSKPAETGEHAAPGAADGETTVQRLDKWLWFARFAKTRTLAARLVEGGKVRVNREKILKPAQNVRIGDVITAAVSGRVRVVKIAAPGMRRGPADEAQGLYEDLTPPLDPPQAPPQGEARKPSRPPGAGRPTKRERRKLDALRTSAGDADKT